MNSRRIEALRNLAERPGTEAEGRLARELLERAEGKRTPDDLGSACPRRCDCGNTHPAFTDCPMYTRHAEIDAEKRRRFPRGTRVYYNRWAYTENCQGTVTGPSTQWRSEEHTSELQSL